MQRIKQLIFGILTAVLLFTTTPISAGNHIYGLEPQISNVSNSINIEQLAAKNKKSVTVYITKTGEKYHTSSCRYLKKSKIAISLSNAKSSGYTACKVCNPPR